MLHLYQVHKFVQILLTCDYLKCVQMPNMRPNAEEVLCSVTFWWWTHYDWKFIHSGIYLAPLQGDYYVVWKCAGVPNCVKIRKVNPHARTGENTNKVPSPWTLSKYLSWLKVIKCDHCTYLVFLSAKNLPNALIVPCSTAENLSMSWHLKLAQVAKILLLSDCVKESFIFIYPFL